jgi:hypothetical protein
MQAAVSLLCVNLWTLQSLCVFYYIYNIYFDFVMSASKVKKTKLEDEVCVFQEKREISIF